jgi:anti-anti-sigma factor
MTYRLDQLSRRGGDEEDGTCMALTQERSSSADDGPVRQLGAARSETRDGVVVLHLTGEVDVALLNDLEPEVKHLCPPDHRLVVDASGVDFMDSCGLSLLLRLWNAHPSMVVRAPSDPVVELLALTGVDSVLTVEQPSS